MMVNAGTTSSPSVAIVCRVAATLQPPTPLIVAFLEALIACGAARVPEENCDRLAFACDRNVTSSSVVVGSPFRIKVSNQLLMKGRRDYPAFVRAEFRPNEGWELQHAGSRTASGPPIQKSDKPSVT